MCKNNNKIYLNKMNKNNDNSRTIIIKKNVAIKSKNAVIKKNINIYKKKKLSFNIFKNKKMKKVKKKKKVKNCCYLLLIVIFDIFFGHALNYRNFKQKLKLDIFSYSTLPHNDKEYFIKQIQDIINLDPYLEYVFFHYFIYSKNLAIRKRFIHYIKIHQKEYWKKAKKYFLIECFIFTIYFSLRTILISREYSCIEEELPITENYINITNEENIINGTNLINSTNITNSAKNSTNNETIKNYWNCYKYKCKVEERDLTFANYVRIFYYVVFYILFLVYKGIVLFSFNSGFKKYQNTFCIITYKVFEYASLVILAFYDYKDGTKCYKSFKNNNLFIKENDINLALLIIDIMLEILK